MPLLKAGVVSVAATGQLVWALGSTGSKEVVEDSAVLTYARVKALAMYAAHPTKSAVFVDDAVRSANHHRLIYTKEMALVGGSLADQELVPGISSYHGMMYIRSILSNTTFTLECTFQDEDDAALVGAAHQINVSLTANVINTTLKDHLMYKGTDAKALEVDLAGGAGVEKIAFVIEYWYET